MSETNRSYRIKANVNEDTFIDVNLNQNIEVFEMLSLKITSENFYKLHTADYGCVAGRVLANGGVGIPNAKLSIFIAVDEETRADDVLSYLYPYGSSFDRNADGIRYNLLPEDKLTDCHQNIGTFPSKRLVLDDDNVLEIFDKYYKFTTTTNVSGDYMIFGVPTGSQTLHMDLDLSDIGDLLSQKPKDLIYKGYNSTMFENANMFKSDKSIDGLAQVFTQTESVYVYPFWGEKSEMGELDSNGVRITRKDVNVDYKFEPTCVFIGSIVTDEKSNGFTKRCIPTERMGKMDRITTGEGTIEMIRKTTDGSVESYTILGNQLIDGNGTWCYQIPMNLDYVTTDEYGNIVPTDDPNKGVPTRTRVRFRFSLTDFESDYQNSHLVKVLVPNNPHNISSELDIDYVFGTNTANNEEGTLSFRDLFYNNVYTVKSYIPRLQHRNFDREKRFSGIKAVNVNVGNNPIPYNNMRIDITFLFTLQCAIMHMLIWIAGIVNKLISFFFNLDLGSYYKEIGGKSVRNNGCITVGDGACPDLEGWYFAPRCENKKLRNGNPLSFTLDRIKEKDGIERSTGENFTIKTEDMSSIRDAKSIEVSNLDDANVCLTNKINHFTQCIEIALAQEYEVIQFDFYNDWINGMLYIPRWFAKIRKKKSFLFGLIKTKDKLQACVDGNVGYQRKYVQQCTLSYAKDDNGRYSKLTTANGCVPGNGKEDKFKCHKKNGRKFFKIKSGYVRAENTSRDQTVYYFKPLTISGTDMKKREVKLFATDIVLLGSLSDRNVNGIPQSFKELVSSTYQMPTNIAATNLGHTGYMYSIGSGSYLCDNKIHDEGVSKSTQNFSSEQKWINGLDYDEDYSDGEYAVTESAGIDWGYTGPGQEYGSKITKGKTEIIEQNRHTLYQPGGHFLGISCTASEANVKSCINLSRVCEIGVSISSRQSVPDHNADNLSYNAVTIPTGVISRDEINDDGFRSEFATMNFNGLETTVDPSTRRRVYKFEIMNPRNFDGTFGKVSDGRTEYNDFNGKYEEDNTTKAFKRTVETNSVDYYDFRLGWHGGTDAELKKKYLIDDSGTVSLPMYENSFYFYFGLHDGATALDRFFSEYFAECPSVVSNEAIIRVETEPATLCPTAEKGSAVIQFIGFEEDVRYAIKQRNPDTGYISIDGNIMTTVRSSDGLYSTNAIELGAGDYTVDIYKLDSEDIVSTKDFSIGTLFPDEFYKFEFTSTDFKNEVSDITPFTVSEENGGYIDFSGMEGMRCVYVVSNGYYAIVKGNCNPSSSIRINGFVNGSRLYAWNGNVEYVVYAVPECGDTVLPAENMGSAYIKMPIRLDVRIGPYDLTTYKSLSSAGIDMASQRWWESLLTGSGNEEHKWSVGKAITYSDIYENGSTGSVDISEIGGNTPYSREVSGYGEQRDDDYEIKASTYRFGDKEEAYEAGYDLSETGFHVPTLNLPSVAKGDYQIRFSDSENGHVESSVIPSENGYVTFPSIYMPFYMKYIIFRVLIGNNVKYNYSLTIYNGTTYNDKFKTIEANSYSAGDSDRLRPFSEWATITQSSSVAKKMTRTWTSSRLNSTKYSAIVEELAPDGYEGDSLSISENIPMPHDGSKSLNTDIRFYLLYKRNSAGGAISTQNGINASKFEGITLVPEGASGGIEYKGSAAYKAFEITDGNYVYYFEPGNELDRNKIFAGNMEDIENINTGNTLIVAVYDPWTELSDEQYAISQNADSRYEYVDRISTSISLISVYDKNTFKSSQANDESYGISEGYNLIDFQYNLHIHGNGVVDTSNDRSLEIYSMGTFSASDNNDYVTIPNIRVTMTSDNSKVQGGYVRIFIVDTEMKQSIMRDSAGYERYYNKHLIFEQEYSDTKNYSTMSYKDYSGNSIFTAAELRNDLNCSANQTMFHLLAAVDLRESINYFYDEVFVTITCEGADSGYEESKIVVTNG